MKRWNKDFLDKPWAAYTVAACSAVLLFQILEHLGFFVHGVSVFFGYLAPILYGIALAYLLLPVSHFFEKTVFSGVRSDKWKKRLGILLTYVVLILVFVILIAAIIPQIVRSIVTFVTSLGEYENSLNEILEQLNAQALALNIDITEITQFGSDILSRVVRVISSNMGKVIGTSYSIGRGVFNVVVSFILAVYFMADASRLIGGVKRFMSLFLKEKTRKWLGSFERRCNAILLRYIGGDLLDGLIVGVINSIFMLIMRMPYVILVSVIVGVTNLAPTFGPIAGGAIGALILLFSDPWDALTFIIFTVILQTVDGYVIKPRLFGSSLGVSSVMILISIILGGGIFGVAGILFAIPFAAIVHYIYHGAVDSLEKRRRSGKPLPPDVSN